MAPKNNHFKTNCKVKLLLAAFMKIVPSCTLSLCYDFSET
ncbi:hypothetical protein X975_01334, partial [Stegodyphus mimosarum]